MILDRLGIADQVTLELNTLGDPESRQAYRQELVRYLEGYRDRLSEDSRLRLERNPMRILDSKDEGDREIVAGAPRLEESLNEASREFFAQVRAGLDALEHRLSSQSASGAWPRLLHPHGLRVHDHSVGCPGCRDRRWPL